MADRKKVMWLIKGLGAGGAEGLLSTAIPYLDRRRFQYEVAYLLPNKNDLVPEFNRADIPVFCLDANRAHDPTVGFRLVKLLKERKVDILHIHLPYTAILGRLSAQLAGVLAVVYTEHNVLEMYRPLTRFFNRLTYPLDTVTITVSDEVQRSALRWKMLGPRKVRTIPGGVDLQEIESRLRDLNKHRVKASIDIPQDHLVVGNVAHIRPEKGHVHLIEAAAKVLEQYPKTTFVIVGREKVDGALQELKTKAAALGIQHRMVFTGFQKDVVAILSTFDVFVLSSLHEGLPIALLEAMAVGVPPVATAVGGIPEVIEDGENGFLVEPKNPTAMSQKIGVLLENPELRGIMSRKARSRVHEKFNIQRMVEGVEDVYALALGANDHHLAEES